MKYYRYEELEDHPLGGGTTYIETEDGWTIRQITAYAGRYFASNINYPQWGLVLADKRIDFDAFDDLTPISHTQFEDVWQAHLAQHAAQWEGVKHTYRGGTPV